MFWAARYCTASCLCCFCPKKLEEIASPGRKNFVATPENKHWGWWNSGKASEATEASPGLGHLFSHRASCCVLSMDCLIHATTWNVGIICPFYRGGHQGQAGLKDLLMVPLPKMSELGIKLKSDSKAYIISATSHRPYMSYLYSCVYSGKHRGRHLILQNLEINSLFV